MANITAARPVRPKYYNKHNVNVLAYDAYSVIKIFQESTLNP